LILELVVFWNMVPVVFIVTQVMIQELS